MKRENIADWQRRYRAQPGVWTVCIGSGEGEETGNLYDSKEAAEIEVGWHHRRGMRSARVVSLGHVHTLVLAKERWA